MPVPVPEAVDAHAALAVAKATQARRLPAYLFSSMLAGAFVGVAVVLLVSVGGPLAAAGAPYARLVQGAVFGVALTLVVFAGAELFTGNAMVMLQGLVARTVTFPQLGVVWVASLAGNIAGSIAFAWMVDAAGSLAAGGGPGKPGPGQALVTSIVTAKNAATGSQLFWRAVLCNMLVCLALWMAARAQSDGAKLAVLWWGLLAFIASGFEHSIANVTTFTLAVLDGTAAWGDLARNLAWTIPGNVVGGGILVGIAYAWIARPLTRSAASPAAARGPIVDVTAVPAPPAAPAAPEPAVAR